MSKTILRFFLPAIVIAAFAACAPRAEVSQAAAPEAATPAPAAATAEVVTFSTPEPTPTATPAPTPTPSQSPSPVPDYAPTDVPKSDGLYKIVVYFKTQSAVVYRAENGRWETFRTMICSTGKRTPEGTYAVYTKYEYHSLYGARGQYCSRITDHILFHSVPIDENAGSIEKGRRRMKLEEYEKLGTPASDGCVRLPCADAKWIYDNCDRTTAVVMTDAEGPTPTAPPALIPGEPYETAAGYGWDPTDPDPENPYRNAPATAATHGTLPAETPAV